MGASRLLSLSLLLALHASVHGDGANEENSTCKGIIDLVFVIDHSGSMAFNNSAVEVKQFIVDVVNVFDMGESKVHLGLIQFSSLADITRELTYDKADFLSAINNEMLPSDGKTSISLGLRLADVVLSRSSTSVDFDAGRVDQFGGRDRGGAKNVLLITDGVQTTYGGDPEAILRAKELKDKGITIISAGFGQANPDTIGAMASEPTETFAVHGNDMQAIRSAIYESGKLCNLTSVNKTYASPSPPPSASPSPPPPSASPSPPPSVSPSPPSPPSEPPEVIIMWNDPHIKFAHGGSADFRGKHNTLFNLLSHTNLTVNVRFSDAKYTDGKRVVTGSYMTEAFVHVATKSGPQLRISLKAGAIKPEHADVEWHQPAAKGPSAATKQLALTPSAANEVSESSTISEGDVTVSVQQGVGSGEALAMTITQKGRWSVGVTTHVYMDESSGKPVEMYRVDVELQPLSKDIEKEAVAPHGLIGQSFDGDEIGVTGKQDDYTKDEVVTTAQAEGAIEGTWTDYIMAEPFANDFKFSRFAGQAAKPRVLDKLKGVKTMRKVSNNPSKIWA